MSTFIIIIILIQILRIILQTFLWKTEKEWYFVSLKILNEIVYWLDTVGLSIIKFIPVCLFPLCMDLGTFIYFVNIMLQVFYFSGITVGLLLIMAAIVSTRDPRFLYIGSLVLPVSAFLMVVQCRVRQDADRRKRHRQLNGRHHHLHHRSNPAAVMVINNSGSQPTTVTNTAETIPLQNLLATCSGDNTLRRQFQGNVYQYIGQRDNEPNYNVANNHYYETTSELQQ